MDGNYREYIHIYIYIYIYGISVAEACQRPLKLLTQLEWRRPVAQGPGEARRGQARPGEARRGQAKPM